MTEAATNDQWNGDWDENRRMKLKAWLQTSADEKMKWLEEMRRSFEAPTPG